MKTLLISVLVITSLVALYPFTKENTSADFAEDLGNTTSTSPEITHHKAPEEELEITPPSREGFETTQEIPLSDSELLEAFEKIIADLEKEMLTSENETYAAIPGNTSGFSAMSPPPMPYEILNSSGFITNSSLGQWYADTTSSDCLDFVEESFNFKEDSDDPQCAKLKSFFTESEQVDPENNPIPSGDNSPVVEDSLERGNNGINFRLYEENICGSKYYTIPYENELFNEMLLPIYMSENNQFQLTITEGWCESDIFIVSNFHL